MYGLDQVLSSLDEIDLIKGKNNEVEKARSSDIESLLDKRSKLTIGEITNLIMDRASIFGVYKLHDDLEESDVKLRAEIALQNNKLEYIFSAMDKKSKKKKEKWS